MGIRAGRGRQNESGRTSCHTDAFCPRASARRWRSSGWPGPLELLAGAERNIRWRTLLSCARPLNIDPPMGRKMGTEWEKQKGMPLIEEKGVRAGEGCLRADVSRHVPSFISSLLFPPCECVCVDGLGVSSFLPSFRSLPLFLSLFVLLFLSLAPSSLLPSFLSQGDSIAIPVVSAHYP